MYRENFMSKSTPVLGFVLNMKKVQIITKAPESIYVCFNVFLGDNIPALLSMHCPGTELFNRIVIVSGQVCFWHDGQLVVVDIAATS